MPKTKNLSENRYFICPKRNKTSDACNSYVFDGGIETIISLSGVIEDLIQVVMTTSVRFCLV